MPWFSSKKSDVLRQKHRAFWHFPLFPGCFQATARCDYAHFSPLKTAVLIHIDCTMAKSSPKSAPERTPKSVKIFEGRRQFSRDKESRFRRQKTKSVQSVLGCFVDVRFDHGPAPKGWSRRTAPTFRKENDRKASKNRSKNCRFLW